MSCSISPLLLQLVRPGGGPLKKKRRRGSCEKRLESGLVCSVFGVFTGRTGVLYAVRGPAGGVVTHMTTQASAKRAVPQPIWLR